MCVEHNPRNPPPWATDVCMGSNVNGTGKSSQFLCDPLTLFPTRELLCVVPSDLHQHSNL